jgi:hypothetical protein
MSRADSHDVFAALAAGHALYALEPEDEQRFLAHLAGCAACERDVAEHRETLAHLAYAADDGEPPPALLEGIRAGVRDSGRASTYARPTELDQARSRRDRPAAGAPRLRRAAPWVGAAAAIALAGSLAVWNTALQRDQQDSEKTLEEIVAQLADSDTEIVPLESPDGGEVLAVALLDDGEMSLVLNGLEPNDAQLTSYVLWGKNSRGGVRAVGAFDVAPSDEVVGGMTLHDEMTAFMVTHEEGNTPPPVSTQPVLAVGEV